MRTIVCMDCHATVPGAAQRRRCSACRVKYAVARRTVRALAPGEQIPAHEPNRYLRDTGYIELRWKVGPRSYVQTYEHRVVDGRVTTEEHVHHVNRDRADNRPENLRPLSATEHYAMHRGAAWAEQAANLYAAGMSTYQIGREVGRNPATVYRRLVKMGVPLRQEARIAIPLRERQSS